MVYTGTIARFNLDKNGPGGRGYGFIRPDAGGPDIFMHASDLKTGTEGQLVPGTRVSYEITESQKGPKAYRVHVAPADVASPAPSHDLGYGDWRDEVAAIARKHADAFADAYAADVIALVQSWQDV